MHSTNNQAGGAYTRKKVHCCYVPHRHEGPTCHNRQRQTLRGRPKECHDASRGARDGCPTIATIEQPDDLQKCLIHESSQLPGLPENIASPENIRHLSTGVSHCIATSAPFTPCVCMCPPSDLDHNRGRVNLRQCSRQHPGNNTAAHANKKALPEHGHLFSRHAGWLCNSMLHQHQRSCLSTSMYCTCLTNRCICTHP